jgi:histidinol-phosphatase
VSEADRVIEELLFETIQHAFLRDAFLGEETGAIGLNSRRWIVDGLDTTQSFMEGGREWGTLIAIEILGEITVGVVTSTSLRRRWWSQRGSGAFTSSTEAASAPERLAVTRTSSLATTTALPLPDNPSTRHSARITRLSLSCGIGRAPWHHALQVAEGRVDASLHLGGGPWDHAALVPIVEEAGGRFTDLLGRTPARYGNGPLHERRGPRTDSRSTQRIGRVTTNQSLVTSQMGRRVGPASAQRLSRCERQTARSG